MIMKKYWSLLLLSSMCLAGESSAFYVEGMYEVGLSNLNAQFLHPEFKTTDAQGKLNVTQLDVPYKNTAMTQGFGVHAGYKQMLARGWFGLRYYGFYDFGVTNFGTNCLVKGLSETCLNGAKTKLSAYGVGLDLLVNFVNFKMFSLGIFGGIAIGGNTWWQSNKHKSLLLLQGENARLKYKDTQFQWLFNVGLRSMIAKYLGIEAGVKVPMMTTPYVHSIMAGDDNGRTISYKETLKRAWSFYASMVIYF